MVDLVSLAKENHDWPLGNAQPSSELLRSIPAKEVEATKKKKQPAKEQLLIAPTTVYVLSFNLKKWDCFEVGGLRESWS
ncbi:hypothetical protein GOP47_0019056 [Adiantum capillus-veneris]|uniref:Uncharacterized protein n=1 Tax=Adiantum capillus-veneris TaxID=13818 RepID=A0A9D4UEY5_ADICA|nr:hypothetical protein GOP47_0019056 [Adiantum capillus-veneris]